MTLYNKDGSVYRLEGPNPSMKDQEFWGKFEVHNMDWKKEVHEDKRSRKSTISPIKKEEVKSQSEEFLEELEASKNELVEEIAKETIKEPIKQENNRVEKNGPLDTEEIKKTFVYCLPAIIREKKDNLYGDISRTIQYEAPTSFEAVIIKQSDMTIEMWSQSNFGKGTILYPKNGDKRWWKIQDTYPKLGGHVIRALPSQDQPAFEN